jgi:3-hydroxyisobutyrate dehydrogenase
MKIAWVGLGNMGVPMVRNLARGDEPVAAYNRTPKEVDLGGATLSASLMRALNDADIIFVMVSDVAAVSHVLFDEDGVVRHAKRGALIVNMSTIGVDETNMVAEHVASLGFDYMDAPVSGSVGPAIEAKLVVLAGGATNAFERVKPYFERMSKAAYHLGPIGSGAAMKLLVNALLGVLMQGSAECIATADKFGFGREQLFDVLAQTAVWAPAMAAKQKLWSERSFEPAFALKHMTKDLGLMSQFANQLGVPAPAIMSTLAMFLSAREDGHADEDMAAISEHMASLAGLS